MNNKPYFVEDFFEVLLEQNIFQYSMLSSENKKNLFELISNKFFKRVNLLDELWKYVVDDHIGVHLPCIPKNRSFFLERLTFSQSVYFLFEPSEYNEILHFFNPDDLMDALSNCYNFNFYIIADDLSGCVIWQRHEALMGLGQYQKQIKTIGREWLVFLEESQQSS